MKALIEKKLGHAEEREAAEFLITEQQCIVSRACKILQLPRCTYHYQLKAKDDNGIHEALTGLVDGHPSIGCGLATTGYVTVVTSGTT